MKEEEEELQYKPPKKKTLPQEATLEAQTAHKEMCAEAMANMVVV